MPELEDPIEIYRRSLADLPAPVEPHPPVIQRVEAWPYPELTRLWVRVETSPFAAFPNLSIRLLGPDQAVVATMFMVEIRDPYQSVTLHLRKPPQPGEKYVLELELTRDEDELDSRRLEFALVFRDPGT